MSAPYSEPTATASTTLAAVQRPLCLTFLQQIAVCGREIRKILARLLGDSDLSDTELLLLQVCGRDEGIAQKQLADAAGLSPAQVSGLVERLSGRGLIEECRLPGDRRRRLWRLTTAGKTTLDQVLLQLAPLTAAWQRQFNVSAETELTRLIDCVREIASNRALDKRPNEQLQGDRKTTSSAGCLPAGRAQGQGQGNREVILRSPLRLFPNHDDTAGTVDSDEEQRP